MASGEVDGENLEALILHDQFIQLDNLIQRMTVPARRRNGLRRPNTISRAKMQPGKNAASCDECDELAVQCICEDEWCQDSKTCKAFKRHSDCCGKEFENKLKLELSDTMCKRLVQSYTDKRRDTEVSFDSILFLIQFLGTNLRSTSLSMELTKFSSFLILISSCYYNKFYIFSIAVITFA